MKRTKVKPKKLFKFVLMIIILAAITAGVSFVVSQCSNPTKPVICIDAGHGGKDIGASNGSRNEKDDNLRLAQAVKTELRNRGYSVVMTRNDDSFPSLEERCELANRKKAELFVALHRNSANVGNGVEIWIKSDDPQADHALAKNILDNLDKTGISKNRGVRAGLEGNASSNYYVNKYTDMPSCLVEMGFITNDEDNKLFDKNLKKYAIDIADGIEKTLNEKK